MGGAGWRYPSPGQPAPVPAQQRAIDTVRAAVEATVDLLERDPEDQVTLDAIRRRSGVSQGSLAHHFGSRDALIATANVARYARSCAADEAFFARLEGAATGPAQFATIILAHIDDMLTPERREVRWLRMAAIAAAFGDPELTATLSDAYTRLIDGLTRYVEDGARSGIIDQGSDPRTIALLISMQAQGLVLDDLVDLDVPVAAWNHFMVRFVTCFLTPEAARELERQEQERFGDLWRAEVFGPPGRVPSTVAERLETLRAGADSGADAMTDLAQVRGLLVRAERGDRAAQAGRDGASGRTQRSEVREEVLRAAVTAIREHGARSLDVAALREQAGLNAQAFHRLFGARDALVREAQIRLEVSRSAHSIARLSAIFAGSRTPAEMRAGIEDYALWMADDASRTSMLQRIETLSASRRDPDLRAALARVQHATRDLLIEQVCRGQAAGLIDPNLPARSVARFFDGTVFWHVFHGLDGDRPSRAAWTGMLQRISRLVSPDR